MMNNNMVRKVLVRMCNTQSHIHSLICQNADIEWYFRTYYRKNTIVYFKIKYYFKNKSSI